MFGFGKKKIEKSDKSKRIDVEDLIEQGYACREIEEELGVSKEEVYRIKEAKKRREGRMIEEDDNGGDSAPMNYKQELARLQFEQARQQMQWDIEDRRRERQMEMREMFGFDGDEEGGSNIEDTLLAGVLSKVMGGNTNQLTHPSPPMTVSPSSPVPPSPPSISTEQVKGMADFIKAKVPSKFLPALKENLKNINQNDFELIKAELMKE